LRPSLAIPESAIEESVIRLALSHLSGY